MTFLIFCIILGILILFYKIIRMEKEKLNSLENLSDEELLNLKNQAIADEDYDKAKEIKLEQGKREAKKLEEEKAKMKRKSTKSEEMSEKKREDLKDFHEIMKITGKRDDFIIRPLEYFQKMYDELRRSCKTFNGIL